MNPQESLSEPNAGAPAQEHRRWETPTIEVLEVRETESGATVPTSDALTLLS